MPALFALRRWPSLAALLLCSACATRGPLVGHGPVLLGRTLSVPEGCNYESQGSEVGISCESREGLLYWKTADLGKNGPEVLDAWLGTITAVFDRNDLMLEGSQTCVIEGIASECREVMVESREQGTIMMLAGTAEVRGKRLLVACLFKSQGPPPVCAEVVNPRDR